MKRILIASIALLTATILSAISVDDVKQFKADKWSIVGKNIMVSGGVHVPVGELELYADEAVVNLENGDVEAVGNVRLYRWKTTQGLVTPAELAMLKNQNNIIVNATGISGDIWGTRNLKVTGLVMQDQISARRAVGNYKTGYFRFDNLNLRMESTACRARAGERLPNGTIIVEDAEFSTCKYLHDDNAHYSISANRATLTPYASDLPGVEDIRVGTGDYAITMLNGFVKVYGVPLLWLPAFYKPRDESLRLFSIQMGKSSGWGYYVMMSRRFNFTDYPNSSVKLMADYYNLRGWGFGATGRFALENSRTDLFAYTIYDLRPAEDVDYDKYRIRVPHFRYDLRLSNVTHITPRLDFRGAIEYSSDPYVARDYFRDRYTSNPMPATYAALEQQFDHFSASIYYRPRINTFYTVVEKVPEVRLDVHRQELFNTNIYYQGGMTAGYDQMRWIKFNENFDIPDTRLHNYQSFRFSMTHFLYYPLNFNFINIVPRAGVKFLAYSNSSKNKVSTDDLLNMFRAASPDGTRPIVLNQYDNRGGARARLAAELGFEASTKIHNTWLNARNRILRIDGLRHIMRPYVNYTYLDVWGADRRHIYYFDDEDRIRRQHFFRFGLENRLQTRDGSSMRDWFTMENYWDFHFERSPGFGGVKRFSQIGNFCTILTANPIKNLTISTGFAIDPTNQNGEVPDTVRKGRNVGKTGLNCRWLNRWYVSISYSPIDDVKITLAYNYNRPYAARSAYSMGSTLTELDSGGFFDKYCNDHNESISASISMPLTPDRRTMGSARIRYDIYKGNIDTIDFFIARRFHCLEVSFNLGFSRDFDKNRWETAYSIQAQLVGLESPEGFTGNSMLSGANGTLRTPDFRNVY